MEGLPSGSRDARFGGGVRIEKPLVTLRTDSEVTPPTYNARIMALRFLFATVRPAKGSFTTRAEFGG